MDESSSRLSCGGCGIGLVLGSQKTGGTPVCGNRCRNRVIRGSFAASGLKACAHCGDEFQPGKMDALFCRPACKVNAWRLTNPGRAAEHRAQEKRRAIPKPTPTESAYFTGYCACGQSLGGRRTHERCEECAHTQVKADARAYALDRAVARHKQDARVVECAECACQFCPVYGASNSTLCVPCKAARERAHKSMHKTLRRVRELTTQVEPVDPYKVFARDGWLCRLCGRATPRAKRGSYADDAPELDHVMPLSKGGAHTYQNTQCACRACNGAKSDRLDWQAA